jgi:hypothetical protein
MAKPVWWNISAKIAEMMERRADKLAAKAVQETRAIAEEEAKRAAKKAKLDARHFAAAERMVTSDPAMRGLNTAQKADEVKKLKEIIDRRAAKSFWNQTVTFARAVDVRKNFQYAKEARARGDSLAIQARFFGVAAASAIAQAFVTGVTVLGIAKYGSKLVVDPVLKYQQDSRMEQTATDLTTLVDGRVRTDNNNDLNSLQSAYGRDYKVEPLPIDYKAQKKDEIVTVSRYAGIKVKKDGLNELEIRRGMDVSEVKASEYQKNPNAAVPVGSQMRMHLRLPKGAMDRTGTMDPKLSKIMFDMVGKTTGLTVNEQFKANILKACRVPNGDSNLTLQGFDGRVSCQFRQTAQQDVLTVEISKQNAFLLKDKKLEDTTNIPKATAKNEAIKKPIGSKDGPSLSGPFKFN